MLRITQLKLRPGHTTEELEELLLATCRLKRTELLSYQIRKQSVDARKKPDIYYSYTVDVQVAPDKEKRILRQVKQRVQKAEEKPYQVPAHGQQPLHFRPVIAGMGPSGLFCAYLLAKEGYRPILVERGAPVEERQKDVEEFWKSGVLNPASNVQFGEGGAGTFSDGKLNTLVKDPCGRNRFVLETFVRFGAPESILYEQKPHIGTDVLSRVVQNMRREILSLGGDVRFHSQITGLLTQKPDSGGKTSRLCGVTVNGTEHIRTEILVLAIGHSARDTFQMLYDTGVAMQAKSFAVGVRIEHPQEMIQQSQYGEKAAGQMPPASYKLAEKLENGRGVYTFCMCPGGYVVNASSEEGRLAVNGMSYHDRAGENANSAVIVTVTPEDYGLDHPLAGIAFQRQLEERAYKAGNGKIPVQCYGDFCQNRPTEEPGDIRPQTKGAYQFTNIRPVFPEELADSLEKGIAAMDRKIHGFARPDAVLSAVESRTSSPVRILRGEDFESSIAGLYPCGEGAGYAGGITSAAMDGLKTAEAIIRQFTNY